MTYEKGSYMGWSNIETWNTKLWIDNVYGLYKTVFDFYDTSKNQGDLADTLEQYLTIIWGGFTPDKKSLKPVNWSQIAERIYDDYEQEYLPV